MDQLSCCYIIAQIYTQTATIYLDQTREKEEEVDNYIIQKILTLSVSDQ